MDSLSPPLSASAVDGDTPPSSGGAKYKLMSPAKLPISRSPCITIPPGLSPTSFLESPVLLSNMKVEPSPTTGSLFKTQIVQSPVGSTSNKLTAEFSNTETSVEEKPSCFEFKPHVETTMVSSASNHQQGQLVPFQSSAPFAIKAVDASDDRNSSSLAKVVTSGSNAPAEGNLDDLNQRGNPTSGLQASQPDQKGLGICDDGYNWRKYGQKLVKGSEFPRSYYKCTYPNCEVKKLFERSHDGQITEIVYKGTHDHPKPQLSRRYSAGMNTSVQEDKSSSLIGQDDNSLNICGQMSNAHLLSGPMDQSAIETNDEKVEGAGSLANRVHEEIDDDDDEDPLSKRRKMDSVGMDVAPVVKPIREPRVVVQTVSEVDILDDGYRWRKYGQKVVRGNPNPRSYYKCTNAGCPVRKHVERASHDPKAVITTYEGKHNHDVPTARNSSHDAAGPMSLVGQSRIRSGDSDTISLDLGVGINSAAENRSNEPPQTFCREITQSQTTHAGVSNFMAVSRMPVSTYYGVLNNSVNQFGSGRNQNESHSVEISPLNHASQYPQNVSRILMGP